MDTSREHIHLIDGTARTIQGNIKVKMIAEKHLIAGESIEAIAAHYDLSLADIHAALTYYYDHQAEFEQQTQQNQALLKQHGISSAELLEKLRDRR